MGYEEEILELTAMLAEKYTHKESSSVSYEAAQMLMGAVCYCLEEYQREAAEPGREEEGTVLQEGTGNSTISPLKEAYHKGYELVLYKVKKTKALYHRLLVDFEAYGCQNYSDTVLKGIPEFFRRYDALFCPQEHILTLDYLILGEPGDKKGVDLIWEYLCCIRLEKEFLKCFHPEFVKQVLFEINPEYQELFLGNICEAVLEERLGRLERTQKSPQPSQELFSLLLDRICPGREELKEYLAPAVERMHFAMD